jgi:hypothetical protein
MEKFRRGANKGKDEIRTTMRQKQDNLNTKQRDTAHSTNTHNDKLQTENH